MHETGEPPSVAVPADTFADHSVKQYLPSSIACRLYLLVVLLQTAVDVAVEADILIQFDDLPPDADKSSNPADRFQRLPVYLGIFALAQYVLCFSIKWARLKVLMSQRVPITPCY